MVHVTVQSVLVGFLSPETVVDWLNGSVPSIWVQALEEHDAKTRGIAHVAINLVDHCCTGRELVRIFWNIRNQLEISSDSFNWWRTSSKPFCALEVQNCVLWTCAWEEATVGWVDPRFWWFEEISHRLRFNIVESDAFEILHVSIIH